jgi:hypothetical protein
MLGIRVLIFGTFASSMAPVLSSNNVHTVGFSCIGIAVFVFISLINYMSGIVCRRAVLNAIYSVSVVDKAVSVCSCEAHIRGQFAYVMRKPVRDLAVIGESAAVSLS